MLWSGGGGRIAVWSVRDTFSGTLTVPAGGSTSYYGQPGTLVRGKLPAPGAIISVF